LHTHPHHINFGITIHRLDTSPHKVIHASATVLREVLGFRLLLRVMGELLVLLLVVGKVGRGQHGKVVRGHVAPFYYLSKREQGDVVAPAAGVAVVVAGDGGPSPDGISYCAV
jgi:hypothetical protein